MGPGLTTQFSCFFQSLEYITWFIRLKSAKRPRTTTWIWNLHDHAHVLIESGVDTVVYTRKVFSSNVAHLSLVFFWLGGIHFHGAYFSTYETWLKDPKHSAAGTCLFELWRSEGLITHIQLKYASLAAIAGSILCITGSYVHMHTLSTVSYHKTFRSISIHHCLFVLGLGSFSWSAHQVHISLPANTLLDSGPVNPYVLDRQVSSKLVNLYLPDISILGSTGQVFNSSTTIVFLGQVSAHHVSVGCVSISVGLYYIHAFTIHVSVLILAKGLLYARNSRLVSDKLELGFRYPCDGPGRGGTCQISPSDHIYLAVFWMYNSLDVVLFNSFWKMQSDVWNMTGGDYSVNSTTINAWLRNLLWSQAGQVIQSYSTSLSGYGFIFLSAHFIWAFSLMFLYSGRGYWQELIESIIWAHHKPQAVNTC